MHINHFFSITRSYTSCGGSDLSNIPFEQSPDAHVQPQDATEYHHPCWLRLLERPDAATSLPVWYDPPWRTSAVD